MLIAKSIPGTYSADAKRQARHDMLGEHIKALHADGVRWRSK